MFVLLTCSNWIFAACTLYIRPLHVAARSGCVQVVQSLVTRGADLQAVDNGDRASEKGPSGHKLHLIIKQSISWVLHNRFMLCKL